MKNNMLMLAVAALAIIPAPVMADALMDAMHECMAVEKDKPNSSRNGLSASEFCAAYAIVKTKS